MFLEMIFEFSAPSVVRSHHVRREDTVNQGWIVLDGRKFTQQDIRQLIEDGSGGLSESVFDAACAVGKRDVVASGPTACTAWP